MHYTNSRMKSSTSVVGSTIEVLLFCALTLALRVLSQENPSCSTAVMPSSGNEYIMQIKFNELPTNLESINLNYEINGSPNTQSLSVVPSQNLISSQPISLNPGDILTYSFNWAINNEEFSCGVEQYSFSLSNPLSGAEVPENNEDSINSNDAPSTPSVTSSSIPSNPSSDDLDSEEDTSDEDDDIINEDSGNGINASSNLQWTIDDQITGGTTDSNTDADDDDDSYYSSSTYPYWGQTIGYVFDFGQRISDLFTRAFVGMAEPFQVVNF